MKIHFLFLCLIAHALYGSELSNLRYLSSINYQVFDPAEASSVITCHKQAPDFADILNRDILHAEEELNKYEEAGCWGKSNDSSSATLRPWVGKAAYGMGALGVAMEVAIITTKGATNPWMIAPLPLLAPVVVRFCFHHYYVMRAKNLISFMKQTQTELQTSQAQSEELHEQPSAAPSNKKKIRSSCSIL